jgi:hypothetical protein
MPRDDISAGVAIGFAVEMYEKARCAGIELE